MSTALQSDRIEFAFDRARLGSDLAWAVVAFVGGCSVFVPEFRVAVMPDWGLLVPPAVFFVAGAALTVVTGALFLRRGPGLVMDHHGLQDRSRHRSLGAVEWDELTWHRVDGGGPVIIEVSVAARARRRRESRLMSFFRQGPVGVAFDNLHADHDAVERALRRFAPSRRDGAAGKAEERKASDGLPVDEDTRAVEGPPVARIGWRHRWVWVGTLVGTFAAILVVTQLVEAFAPATSRHVQHLGAPALAAVVLLLAELGRVGRWVVSSAQGGEVELPNDAVVASVVRTDSGERVEGWLTPDEANDRAAALAAAGLRPVAPRYHAAAFVCWVGTRFVGATLAAAGVLVLVDETSRVPEGLAVVLVLVGAVLYLVGPRAPRWFARRDEAGR